MNIGAYTYTNIISNNTQLTDGASIRRIKK